MKAVYFIPLLIAAFALSDSTWAEVQPNSLFSEGAVLQQDTNVPVWGKAKDGEKIAVQFDGQSATAVTKGGNWMVRLKPHKAGGPFTLTIAGENTITVNNVMVGEVWICSGQSNMEFKFNRAANAATEGPVANYPKLRMFFVANKTAIQPLADLKGNWVECSPKTVNGFSAVGYFFGRDIHKVTGGPVGMILSSWGGTPAQAWTSLSGLEKDQALQHYVESVKGRIANYEQASAKYPQELADYTVKLKQWNTEVGNAYSETLKAWTAENEKNKGENKPLIPKPPLSVPKPAAPEPPDGGQYNPTTLYNGMIAPLIPYAIRGAIWYQGEANNGNGLEYRTLFPRMIADWRENWGQGEFPFLFVQIAPNAGISPGIREAQLLSWKKTANTAMVVTTDVGDATNIHPTRKEPVGVRLALAARALVYGEKIEYSGPEYESFKVEQDQVILSFEHVGSGLIAKDGPLKGFTIAGADHKFVPTKAEIQGDTVVVSSDQVVGPVAVRFGWENVPDVNLWNKEGLPASPFRTDTNSDK